MTDGLLDCSCVIDCSGLHEIANTRSNNLRSFYLDQLLKGVIGVPTSVWQEFTDLYVEKSAEFEPYVARKIQLKKLYNVGAATIADKINSRFSRGPYDRHADLYAASICSIEGYTLLTTRSQLADYKKMDCCKIAELTTWADGQGN